MKKRVLFLLACDIGFTGTPLFVNSLICNLDSSKYEFYVYTPKKIKANVYGDNVVVIEGNIANKNKLLQDVLLKHSLKKQITTKFDIVHINTSNIHIANAYVSFFSRYGGKIICHSHNVIEYRGNILYKLLVENKRKNIVDKSGFLFACSPEAGKAMFGNDAEFVCVKNFIDIDKFRFSQELRSKIRKKYGDKIILGNIGAFNGQKNQIFLIKLMERLDDRFILLLIGDGVQKQSYIEYCKEKNLRNLFFIDSTSELQQYYSCFDIFLLPSLFEGFGRVLLEAMVSNLDIITSDNVESAKTFGLTNLPLVEDLWINAILKKAENLNSRFDNVNIINENGYDAHSIIDLVDEYYQQ